MGWQKLPFGRPDYARSLSIYRELISSWQALGNYGALARCLEAIAFCRRAQQHAGQAAQLLGAAESLRERTATSMLTIERAAHELG